MSDSRILQMLWGDAHDPQDPLAARTAVYTEMKTLPEDIKAVLHLRDQGLTYDDIAQHLQLERDKVRQLEAKGLRLLRNPKRGLHRL